MNFYRLEPTVQRAITINRLLKYIKEYVYPYHPYYRKRYKELGIDINKLNTYEDFIRLPIIEKKDYREDPKAFILQPTFPGREPLYDTAKISKKHLLKFVLQTLINRPFDFSRLYRKNSFKDKVARRIAWEYFPIHFHASAGTTGDPTPATYTYYELHNIFPELTAYAYIQPDKPQKDRNLLGWDFTFMNIFPGTPHLAFFQTILSKLFTGISCFDTCGGAVMPTEQQIKVFYENKFRALSAIPSYLVYWLRKAVEMKKEGRIGSMSYFWGCIIAGEPVSNRLKEYMKELASELDADKDFRIIEAYGMTESKWAFWECDEGTKIHLNPKYFFWEVVNKDTLKPVKEGEEGVLVFSHIGWRGTVFIRYNTGDLIQGGIRWRKCPTCGYTFVILYPPIMRAKKDFTKLKGTRVSLLDLIESVRDTAGVKNFQIILTKEDEQDEFSRDNLVLHILPDENVDKEKLTELLKRKVKSVTEVTPDKIIYEDDPIKFEQKLFQKTGIKAEYIIDKRKFS